MFPVTNDPMTLCLPLGPKRAVAFLCFMSTLSPSDAKRQNAGALNSFKIPHD